MGKNDVRRSQQSARERFNKEMQREMFSSSPLGEYLTHLRSSGPDGAQMADALEADLIETFQSESGLRVLKLFEKSVLLRAVPNGCGDGALRENNAVRNFVLEIRRLASNV